ncbi:hypothetical protein [Geodermatophilus telluris]|uniref:hypothetical protein n=1 Tax=Geodermatophilus telluris TaxID=1190417 RepID=UPI0011138567|nr:hypothetical protein [Geodermatophilus telluris]
MTTLYGDAGDPPAAPATGTPSPSSAGPAPDTTPAPDTGATPPPPAPPPRGGGTADLVLPDRLYVLEPLTRDDPFATSLLTACAGGDRGGCTQLLDLLAQDCLDGDLAACDGLYAVTPVGSPFEEVAATCGHRFPDASSAGRCSGE